MTSLLRNAIALAWGLAEATVFVIVPDVFLSWLALQNVRSALVACLYALLGAVAGGSLLWLLASGDPAPVRSLLASLPGIDASMIAGVRFQLQSEGLPALFLGPLSGTPYKLYALEAADLQLGYWVFIAISIPARLLRFVLVTIMVGALNSLLRDRLSLPWRRGFLVACWIGFYAWYFHAIGSAPITASS